MLQNTSKEFYDELVDKIGELLFGTPKAHSAYPYRTLVDSWLKQNGLGPGDVEILFREINDESNRVKKRRT